MGQMQITNFTSFSRTLPLLSALADCVHLQVMIVKKEGRGEAESVKC